MSGSFIFNIFNFFEAVEMSEVRKTTKKHCMSSSSLDDRIIIRLQVKKVLSHLPYLFRSFGEKAS